ncbi:MAG: pilus assembly PilX N-terminal domain-containing protein [Brevundimonas sp.]
MIARRTRTPWLLRRRASADTDAGIALVMVVGAMMVLAMLALTALSFTMASSKFARGDQDYSSAMAAAQSGVDDYIARLNRNDTYYSSVDCSNKALKGPMTVANSCGYTASTAAGWIPVNASQVGPRDAFFHYSVDTSYSSTQGTITLRVTGKANGQFRTIESAVGKGGSTDFVYYTDFESADPSNKQAYSSTPSAACGGSGYDPAIYWWEGRSSSSCTEITFVAGDVLEGSVFSNDSVLASGPTFTNGFQTANPDCRNAVVGNQATWKYCLRKTGSTYSTANFNNKAPQYSSALYLDDTSAAFATAPGCHYFGSTRIIFSSDGYMTVWNKKTSNGNTAPTGSAAPGYPLPSCGTLTALDSAAGAKVLVPDDMVIYVAAAPSSVARRQCYSGELGGSGASLLPLGTFASTTPVTPTSAGLTYTYDTNMSETTKFCAEGNAYIEGTLKGRVTVASAQSIIATGDVVLAGGLSGSDMLGLVATNSVEVFHPWVGTVTSAKTTSTCTSSCTYKWGAVDVSATTNNAAWPRQYNDPDASTQISGLQIMGSIQTLQHSFYVQKYNVGAGLGLLQVNGSIAQRWRGIVGTGTSTTGYLKKYIYDNRLKYSAPPYFPKWVNAQWSQRYFGEMSTPQSLK